MQLAQINIGRPRYPLDDPRIADFVDNLDRVNALAERSDGFVWRLKDETGNATQISAFDDPSILLNMSVWRSVETLEAFAYQTVHRRFVQRRHEWFERFDGLYLALWWVEEGAIPTAADGRQRLAHLEKFGPTAWAFTFKKRFPPVADAAPLGEVGDGRGCGQTYRSCG
jgi:hypothetical protein